MIKNELSRDRTKVCEIISEMLNDPDGVNVVSTITVCQKLVDYIQQERIQAIGWMHSEACTTLDKGNDIRSTEISGMLDKAMNNLDLVPER